MSKLVVGVGITLLAAGGTAFYLQTQANHELQREVAQLRDEVRAAAPAAPAGGAGGSPSAPAPATAVDAVATAAASAEIAKLREEVTALRKSTTALVQFAQAAQAAKDLAKNSETVPTNLIPASQWKNAGKGTPAATAETVLWAAVGGDVDTLSGSLTFTATAREKADAWFAGLSDSVRQQYGSPEKVIALMIAKDAATLSGMQVIGQKEIGADNVGVRVRFANSEGKTKDDTFVMNRGGDGWRLVLPDDAVTKFARQLSGGK